MKGTTANFRSRILIAISGITFFSNQTLCQQLMAATDSISNRVVRLTNLQFKKESYLASGFFLSQNGRLLLVTAAHVARRLNLTSSIYNPLMSNEAFFLADLSPCLRELNWKFSDKADVAILSLDCLPDVFVAVIQSRSVQWTWLESNPSVPYPVEKVSMIGYGSLRDRTPKIINSTTNSYMGILVDDEFGKGDTCIVVEDTSIAGFSGGPVVRDFRGKPLLIGIVHGSFHEKSELSKHECVVPSFRILELLGENP